MEGSDDLTEAVVAHHTFPDDYRAPEALITALDLGEQRTIVAGGLKDQPAGEWAAARHARYVWDLLEAERDVPKGLTVSDVLSERDLIVLRGDPTKEVRPGEEPDEGLLGVRKKIRQKHAKDSNRD